MTELQLNAANDLMHELRKVESALNYLTEDMSIGFLPLNVVSCSWEAIQRIHSEIKGQFDEAFWDDFKTRSMQELINYLTKKQIVLLQAFADL